MSYKVSNYVKEWTEKRLRTGHLKGRYSNLRHIIHKSLNRLKRTISVQIDHFQSMSY